MDVTVDADLTAILRSLAPEEVDMLRDAFIYMDRDSDGYVSKEEMFQKVESCVGVERYAPLREYLDPLFHVADKDGDGRLSLTEFLMAFANGPGVVPAEVVNSCVADVRVRLTDEEMSALQDSFRRIDTKQDGLVDAEELEEALRLHLLSKFPDLTGENFKDIVAVVMTNADTDQDGFLSLSEFIRSYQVDQGVLPASFLEPGAEYGAVSRQLTEEETAVLREAFAVLDRDEDGLVDIEDFYSALWDTLACGVEDPNQIRDICDLIMMTAGRGRRGQLTANDFVRGFLHNVHLMQIPVVVAQERVRVACDKLQEMYDSGELERIVLSFEDLDKDGDAFQLRAEMVELLKGLFHDAFPGWEEDMLTSVMTAIVVGAETGNNGRLTLQEFIQSFVEEPASAETPPTTSPLPEAAAASAASRKESSCGSGSGAVRLRRFSTATDDDLARITEAVAMLHARDGEDTGFTAKELQFCIASQYTANPHHGEEMYHYTLQQFVQPREDGLLEWNEHVHIEDGEVSVMQTECIDPVAPAGAAGNTSSRISSIAAALQRRSTAATDGADPSSSSGALLQEGMKGEAVGTTVPHPPAAADTPMPADTVHSSRPASVDSSAARSKPLYNVPSALAVATSRRLMMSNSGASAGSQKSPSAPYFDEDLEQQFSSYDLDGNGYLDREEFKRAYMSMEYYGLPPSPQEVDQRFRRYAHGSDKIYFNEFCVLMLQRSRM